VCIELHTTNALHEGVHETQGWFFLSWLSSLCGLPVSSRVQLIVFNQGPFARPANRVDYPVSMIIGFDAVAPNHCSISKLDSPCHRNTWLYKQEAPRFAPPGGTFRVSVTLPYASEASHQNHAFDLTMSVLRGMRL
jgi:hypothetical protein